jgi:hypothetical protein
MRPPSSFALSLGLASALLTVAPLLHALPRHKASAKSKSKSNAKPEPEPEPAAKPAAEPEPEPAAEAEKPPQAVSDAAASTPKAAPAAAAINLTEASTKTPEAEANEARDSSDDAALGRREAARIAAGRIQVAVALSAGVAGRHFSYSDPIGNRLAPYTLGAAPMASFELEAYPAASSGIPVLRDLGFRGRVSRAFAFDSNTPQGVTLETSWTRFGGELRQRLLLPSSHPLEIGVFAGADASYFGMNAKAAVPALLPASRNVALRFGFDGRLLLGWRLSLLLGGAYLAVTSRGEIYEHFRSPRVAGVDSDGGFVVALGSGLEARLTGRYTRYFAKFKPQLGNRYVAGGALDEQWQAGLGVRYAH